MNRILELAEEWDVDPKPLIQAVEDAARRQQRRESERLRRASAEPAQAEHRLKQARKAIEALPLRAKVHLHWRMAERLAYGPYGLNAEQVRQVMEDTNWVDEIMAALTEPLDDQGLIEFQHAYYWETGQVLTPEDAQRRLHGLNRTEPLRLLLRAWQEAGGQVLVDDRYNFDLIDFLQIAYRHLGETLSEDAVRCRLDRFRRSPTDSKG